MIRALFARFQQGHRTMTFPKGPAPELPERFRGRPSFGAAGCSADCKACVETCSVGALARDEKSAAVRIDLGKCLFCGECARTCPAHAFTFTREYRLATRRREDLLVSGSEYRLAAALNKESRRLFGRSLKLRQVSAGGCNACEADTNVLNTVGWDLGRFGVQFVASPRHADGILVTGCVSDNMKSALLKTYEAVPAPKLVIAVGACAISGGPFIGHPEIHNGVSAMLPVDLFIPGCPPHPLTILDGLLRLLGRI
jgi:Ni,Fe-hydrogenase III small subunit/NAD-dependent dihydropyrimidine dehydrogenase PreA subunit